MFKKCFYSALLSISVALVLASTVAQEDLSEHWAGVWVVEGTLFSVAIAVDDSRMKVTQIESLGFLWSNKDGTINGNTAVVEVEFAGVVGRIQAELVDPNTAIAFAASCLPEFMVVCILAKDQQAVFRKVLANSLLSR